LSENAKKRLRENEELLEEDDDDDNIVILKKKKKADDESAYLRKSEIHAVVSEAIYQFKTTCQIEQSFQVKLLSIVSVKCLCFIILQDFV
jgi:hypothetical protein